VKGLWVDKYKPHSLEELAVHKKKVKLICCILQMCVFTDLFLSL
jgi:hypothetical protein